jgi:hypothetical protein
MFLLNTILAWSINIIMNKKYDNNIIIIASRAYFLQLYALVNNILSLCMIMAVIGLLVGRFQSFASLHLY